MLGMNRFFSRWGIWALLSFALVYYGQYYRAGLYPAAEGGVEGMTAIRLMAGWRPIADTFLGYNLLWFYPIVGLFKIFGPSYTVLRLFFLLICTLTGLISFRVIRLGTGNATAAFLAAFLVILIPGQMFRNYMAFIVMLNLMAFLPAFILPARSTALRLLWMAASGITLAIAWLIRVDVGFFLTLIWLGLVAAYPLGREGITQHLGTVMFGVLLAALCLSLLHLPFYREAVSRGFAPQFIAQYMDYPNMIQFQGKRLLDSLTPKRATAPHPSSPMAPPQAVPQGIAAKPNATWSAAPVHGKKKEEAQATLERRSLIASSARDTMLAINLYAPLVISALLVLGTMTGWLLALWRHDEKLRVRNLTILTAVGCSLTLFPQYFFWRPDMVHLSEFMVPMTVALVMAITLILQAWKSCGTILRYLLGSFALLSALTLILYSINACQSQSSGGIAVSLNKRFDFQAANGVNVKLTKHELQDASAIYRIVTAVSAPGDYLVCYPYNPEINFMTDRPSYEYNFYIDNAMIPPDRFYKETVGKIGKYHPAAFVITDWPINNTDESKFSNWASETYDYIKSNYALAYKDGNVEVFVRLDRVHLIPADLK